MPENDAKEKQELNERPTGQQPKSENTLNPIHNLYFGMAEKTEQTSSYIQASYYKPYNPSDIYQKRGDHEIFQAMYFDDQVNVCLQLKKDLIVGCGWDIVSDDESSKHLVDDLFLRLEQDPDESLDDYLDTLVDNAQTFGFGCAEKVFKKRPDGSLTLRSLKTRHPDSWLIHTDDQGNVTHYESRGANSSIKIDPKSILKYTPTISTVGPYGISDLEKVYGAWFTKRHIARYYAIFLEKAASPVPIAKYDKVVPQEQVEEIFNIIKKFQTKSALAIPKEFDVTFLESKSNGESYTKGINMFNMFIGRGLFIPDLLGFQGSVSGGGSQALGREQIEMFMKHIMRRRRSIERLINKQIIQPIIIFNNGLMESYPSFKFRPPTEDDTKEYAKLFIEAFKGRLYKPSDDEINHLRSLLKFPEGAVDRPTPTQPPGTIGTEVEPDDDPNDPEPGKKIEPKPDEKETEKFSKQFGDAPGNYSQKTNFKAIESELNASESRLVAALRPIIEDQYNDLFDQIRRKKILGDNPKPERINTIKIKHLKKMNSVINKALKESYKRQGEIALSELFKNNFAQVLPSETFLAVLDEEVFNYVGDYEYNISQNSRLAMQDAIRDGRPVSSVIEIIDSTMKGNSIASVERYARTKHTDVMNQARLAEFENSKVVDAYQFNALMDSRVSEICSGLHGKIISKADAGNFAPPLHFNCRSVLTPITIFEDKVIDTEIGGTVAVRDPRKGQMVERKIKKQPIKQFLEENHGLRIKGDNSKTKDLLQVRKSRGV